MEQKNLEAKYNLNEKQRLVFGIVCDQTLGEGKIGDQLILGVFGEGGTGKTQIVNAIRDWFTRTERRLSVTATTGTAAVAIKGNTVHSELNLTSKSLERQNEKKFLKRFPEDLFPP